MLDWFLILFYFLFNFSNQIFQLPLLLFFFRWFLFQQKKKTQEILPFFDTFLQIFRSKKLSNFPISPKKTSFRTGREYLYEEIRATPLGREKTKGKFEFFLQNSIQNFHHKRWNTLFLSFWPIPKEERANWRMGMAPIVLAALHASMLRREDDFAWLFIVGLIRLDGDAGGRRQSNPQNNVAFRKRREVAIRRENVVPVPSCIGVEFSGFALEEEEENDHTATCSLDQLA